MMVYSFQKTIGKSKKRKRMMKKKLLKNDMFETESVFIFCFRIFPKFRVQIDFVNLEK